MNTTTTTRATKVNTTLYTSNFRNTFTWESASMAILSVEYTKEKEYTKCYNALTKAVKKFVDKHEDACRCIADAIKDTTDEGTFTLSIVVNKI